MKTARQWAIKIDSALDCPNDGVTLTEPIVKQAQLDAYKQGMTDAAGIASWAKTEEVFVAITTARDRKTSV